MTLQRFKSKFFAKSEASRESMRRATFTPPYHHLSGRLFETYNQITQNTQNRDLMALLKLSRGAQAKIFRAFGGKLSSGNTARCLLKAAFLPHSEQKSPIIHIKKRLKQQNTPPRPFVEREERRRGERKRTAPPRCGNRSRRLWLGPGA